MHENCLMREGYLDWTFIFCNFVGLTCFICGYRVKCLPSVLWRCWLVGRKGIRPVKNWVVGCCVVVWDEVQTLHIAQQMPVPLTISCSAKSRLVSTCLVLPFWYLLTRVVPDIFQKSSKTVVCVCVCVTELSVGTGKLSVCLNCSKLDATIEWGLDSAAKSCWLWKLLCFRYSWLLIITKFSLVIQFVCFIFVESLLEC